MSAVCSLCAGAGEVGFANPVTGEAMGMDCPECTPGVVALTVWPDRTAREEDEGLTEAEMIAERDLDEREADEAAARAYREGRDE